MAPRRLPPPYHLRSKVTSLEERFKRLNVESEDKHFRKFSQSVPPRLVERYLEILEELFKHFRVAPGNLELGALTLKVATGVIILAWDKISSAFGAKENKSIEDKFVELAFLRRYPDYYENEQIDWEARASIFSVSLDQGRSILERATEPSTVAVDVVRKGYLSDYVGRDEIVTPILSTLNENASSWRPEEYHAPYTSLIGPTMIGKTRLLMELADEICVVYICLRLPNSSGEPKRSQLATEMLETPLGADLEVYYVQLITAILSVTIKFFQSASKRKDCKELFRAWYQHHNSPNTKFYSNVQSELKRLTGKNDVVHQLILAAEKLGKTHILKSSPLKVLLAIDEANTLLDKPKNRTVSSENQSEEPPLFRFFRRALRNVPDSSGFFAILVDTNSCVANFSPRTEDDPSCRSIGTRAEPFKLYPPIYELRTMDRMVPADPPRSWAELFLPERLCSYGVPFFGSYLKTKMRANLSVAVDKMARFALNKLLCSFKEGPIKITESRALALLGPTIGVPLHGQARLNSQLMASHAAHCGYIDANRDSQYAFYPSQPIYALAANYYLQTNEDVLISCINSLTAVLSQGDVGPGDAGEIASRIILLCAMNKTAADMKTAKETSADLIGVKHISFPDPVPVIKFLETLTGISAHELPLGSIDANHKRKLLEHGMMFWNHFMHFSERPTTESMLECLHRGLALQCRSNQEAFDQVLTIYLKDQFEDELDEANVTFCGIQVKNRKYDSELKNSQGKMNPEKAKIEIKEKTNPYLSLYFTLQNTPPKKKENYKRQDNYKLPSNGPPDYRQASLVFYGLDSFHFLSPGLKEALKQLIDIRTDLVSRHGKRKQGLDYVTDFFLRSTACRLN
ncbi:hypothetical protein PGTUg99_015363 [Puccinia graminis f. sp. tritici]|uniref:Uncharacterized protein n=1 Tax=Puccinia graminis f. sp. tritici TaxID=56615 RepID=A0A5B0MH62_PUCGR|nr:hypothetical protein PGTUg99_015363 [Puccinia graminis f. sp. tritici]